MLFASLDDFLDRRDVAIHRIDRFERHQLGAARFDAREQAIEILDIIVLELEALGAAVANAFDHRGMVERVRQHDAIRQFRCQRAKRRPVRDIARGEQQRVFLAVQIRKLEFKLAMGVHGTRNVAGAAGAGARAIKLLVHRFDDVGMLAHAEIIVGAPDGDFLQITIFEVAGGARVFALAALQFGKNAVIAALLQAVKRCLEMGFIIHRQSPGELIAAHFPAPQADSTRDVLMNPWGWWRLCG